MRPHYYFGVTAKDLRDADDTPTFDNDLTYERITTPPPDVVPHTEIDAKNAAASTTHPGTTTQHAAQQQSDSVYADCARPPTTEM